MTNASHLGTIISGTVAPAISTPPTNAPVTFYPMIICLESGQVPCVECIRHLLLDNIIAPIVIC